MFTIVFILTVMAMKLIMFHPGGKTCGNENNNKPVSINVVEALNIITR